MTGRSKSPGSTGLESTFTAIPSDAERAFSAASSARVSYWYSAAAAANSAEAAGSGAALGPCVPLGAPAASAERARMPSLPIIAASVKAARARKEARAMKASRKAAKTEAWVRLV